jgi:hypothetical protein
MKFFDSLLENSPLIKSLISAVESTTQLMKELSVLCASLTERVNEQQTALNQIYDLLEQAYSQEMDAMDELRLTDPNKKNPLN